MNLQTIHVTLGELGAKISAMEKSFEQGRVRNIKELDSIRDEMSKIKNSIDDLNRTANIGLGAWKAILAFGTILGIIWSFIKIFGRG